MTKGFTYYRHRNKRKKKTRIKRQSDAIGTAFFYLLLFPFVALFKVLESRTSTKKTSGLNNIRPYQTNRLPDGFKIYPVQVKPKGPWMDYLFYMDNQLNDETYNIRLKKNEEVLVHLINHMNVKGLMQYSGIDKHTASLIGVHRPYTTIEQVLAKVRGFEEANLHHWVLQLDRKAQQQIIPKENRNDATGEEIHLSLTSSSITLHWGESVEQAIISRNGTIIAEVTNVASYTDTPLYADKKYTYKIVLIDRFKRKQTHIHTAQTLDDGVAFRGLSPAAFDRDVNTYHKGAGAVTWLGDIANKKVEIKYRHTGKSKHSKTTIYLRDDSNKNYTHKKNQNYVTASGTNNMQKVQIIIPRGATKLVFNSSDTIVYDITLVE